MSIERWYSEWITEAPDNFTVSEAAQAERNDMAWPISGDATTICRSKTTQKETK